MKRKLCLQSSCWHCEKLSAVSSYRKLDSLSKIYLIEFITAQPKSVQGTGPVHRDNAAITTHLYKFSQRSCCPHLFLAVSRNESGGRLDRDEKS